MDTSYLEAHIKGLDYAISMAIQSYAEIEGMKAENQVRLSRGEAPAYGEDAFFNIAGKNDMNQNASITRHQF